MGKRRVHFQGGWAEADLRNWAPPIGDRVVPAEISVEFPGLGGQPGLRMRLAVVDGVPQCRELCVSSVDGGREVRTLDLRAVRLNEWVEDIFAAFAGELVNRSDTGVATVVFDSSEETALGAVKELQAARRGKGARKITPRLLEDAAAIYSEHIADRPIPAVAKAFGVSERSASDYVTRARRAGLLPETTRGKKKA